LYNRCCCLPLLYWLADGGGCLRLPALHRTHPKSQAAPLWPILETIASPSILPFFPALYHKNISQNSITIRIHSFPVRCSLSPSMDSSGSSVFSATLQEITTKLQELSKSRTAFETKRAKALASLAAEKDSIKRLEILSRVSNNVLVSGLARVVRLYATTPRTLSSRFS
jgi:hypothetical protein